MPSIVNNILLLCTILASVHGCYKVDLHHELPCQITIEDPPAASRSPSVSSPSSPVPPSIQGAPQSQTQFPTSSISVLYSLQPVSPPSTLLPLPFSADPSTQPTTAPSTPLTALPSLVLTTPTVAPSTLPWQYPTKTPTAKPSNLPILVITRRPSLPSKTELSGPPSATPAPPSTSKPPSLASSSQPTAAIASATSAPSSSSKSFDNSTCRANSNGFFGGASGSRNIISYGYELETTPINQSTLQNEVLPALETSFVNSLLPNLFGDQCGTRRLQAVRRGLETLGISSRPDDVPLSNVQCKTNVASPSNNCSVISGELTLFTDDNSTEQGRSIQSFLQASMTNGSYDKSNSRIVRVTYVDLGSYSSIAGGNSDKPKGSESSNASSRYILAIVPTVAAAVLVLAAIIWRRRRRHASDADDSTNQSASRAPQATGGVPGLDEIPPGLPAPMSLEEGTVYTTESNH